MSSPSSVAEDICPLTSKDIDHSTKRKREPEEIVDENMSNNSAEANKRANFSTISPNGLSRNSIASNGKGSNAKKIIIKNFKCKTIYFLNVISIV